MQSSQNAASCNDSQDVNGVYLPVILFLHINMWEFAEVLWISKKLCLPGPCPAFSLEYRVGNRAFSLQDAFKNHQDATDRLGKVVLWNPLLVLWLKPSQLDSKNELLFD